MKLNRPLPPLAKPVRQEPMESPIDFGTLSKAE
jgi:hypothetical protein